MKLELARDIYIPDYEAEKGKFTSFFNFYFFSQMFVIYHGIRRSLFE